MIKLNNLSLTVRFSLLASGLILLTALSSQTFFGRQERIDLEKRLQEKATFLNSFYSYLIADSLMRKDDITLIQVVNRLEQDEEITAVVVVDQHNEVRYHIDPEKMGRAFDDPLIKQVLKTGEAIMVSFQNSGGKALGIVAPLKIQGGPGLIGVARMDLTFRRVDNELSKPRHRYWFVIFGSLITAIGLLLVFVNRWVIGPLDQIATSLSTINVALPESQLPETRDELGAVSSAINNLISRFKNELNQQASGLQSRAELEKLWVQRLLASFLPNTRIIIADKDNRIISDSEESSSNAMRQRPHLLDLIKDANFGTLLTGAFQKEGEVVRGPVTFQENSYEASILSVPLQQAVVVKTLIALQPK